MSPSRRLIDLGSRAALLWVAVNANADTRHVPAEYLTIQAAIDDANPGDTVLVADGTFSGAGNRDLDFSGKAIAVRSANGAANCIIDCQAAGRAFHFHSGETTAARVDGLTLRGGEAPSGSAILCELGSGPTITNCVFTGNHATAVYPDVGGALACLASAPTIAGCAFQANTAVNDGGAAVCLDGGDAEFTNCRFEDNTAQQSGALVILRSSPAFTDCQFIRNEASLYCCGAGVAYDNCSVQLTRCAFIENVALGPTNGGGGFVVQLNSQADVRDCLFVDNFTASGGGGLWCGDYAELTLTNTTFLRNRADTASGGGVLVTRNSQADVRHCVFLGNQTPTNSGGGLRVGNNSQADVSDCEFIGNVASFGAGLWCGNDSLLTLTNATIRSNVASTAGGALRISQNTAGTSSLLNSILWNNSPNEVSVNVGIVAVTYSNVRNGWAGTGNIAADPLFVRNPDPGSDAVWGTPDDDYGDSRLTTGSPCIDAGHPTFAPSPCAHDLAHACRIWDGDANSSVRVDMGAYEFASLLGDLDGDCSVDQDDLDAVLFYFGQSVPLYTNGDVDGDGLVTQDDLDFVLFNFGVVCP